MNEISIRVSVKFTARERSLQRLPSKKSTGVFGVNIAHTARFASLFFEIYILSSCLIMFGLINDILHISAYVLLWCLAIFRWVNVQY